MNGDSLEILPSFYSHPKDTFGSLPWVPNFKIKISPRTIADLLFSTSSVRNQVREKHAFFFSDPGLYKTQITSSDILHKINSTKQQRVNTIIKTPVGSHLSQYLAVHILQESFRTQLVLQENTVRARIIWIAKYIISLDPPLTREKDSLTLKPTTAAG